MKELKLLHTSAAFDRAFALGAPSHLASAAWAVAGSSSRQADRARYAERAVHREFSWDALSVTKDTECGGTKCYFPSSLQGERGDEGWLVGHSHVGSLAQWRRAWALAEELITHFGVNHLLRGRRVARSDSTPPTHVVGRDINRMRVINYQPSSPPARAFFNRRLSWTYLGRDARYLGAGSMQRVLSGSMLLEHIGHETLPVLAGPSTPEG